MDLVSQNSLMAVNTLANKKIGSEDGIGIYEDKEGHKHNLNYINGTPYKDRKVSDFKGEKIPSETSFVLNGTLFVTILLLFYLLN